MKILFILYHGMECNSAHHVRALAEQLALAGDRCTVAVPDAYAPVLSGAIGGNTVEPLFSRSYVAEKGGPAVVSFGALRRALTAGATDEAADIVVAWTPRENLRPLALAAARRWRVPCVVHLEDNEDAITARYLGVPCERIAALGWWTLRRIRGLALSHPRRMRSFMQQVDGTSMIISSLSEFAACCKPSRVFWPGYDEALFNAETSAPAPEERRRILRSYGVADNELGLVYTGNIHYGNAEDMQILYATVATLNHCGTPTRLIRTGETHVADFEQRMGEAMQYVNSPGLLPRRELPHLIGAADVLVQPGLPGIFNDYRFPSKLPEYLVSGRPVVMTRTNLGRYLSDGEEALVVPGGQVGEMVDAVQRLAASGHLCAQLGHKGRAFARHELRWHKAAEAFRELLTEVCDKNGLKV